MQDPDVIRLFLCGDVMTGRGIDQILSSPSNPALHEPYVRDARSYVELAESVNGPLPRKVEPGYIWGDALTELERAKVDVRVVNLETSITRSEDYWRGKGINYRMHPDNIGCITAAGIHCCCLANNHVLDWGYDGLDETLRTLDTTGIAHAGAGRNAKEAAAPAVLEVPGKGRVLVFAYGSPTSGVPREWRATDARAGVNLLEEISAQSARRIAAETQKFKRKGDVIVASIHWGGNWGYRLLDDEVRFAHRLIEEGVDIVHGHSSHHVKTVEIYNDRLVLYGCGDFLNDYEGIGGYEEFRSELALMYLAAVNPKQRRPVEATLVPMRVARFRLNRASDEDVKWLRGLLSELGAPFGTQIDLAPDGSLIPRVTTSRSGQGLL